MSGERRLWAAVLLQACLDLNDPDALISKQAHSFFTDETGALTDICRAAGINCSTVRRLYRERKLNVEAFGQGIA